MSSVNSNDSSSAIKDSYNDNGFIAHLNNFGIVEIHLCPHGLVVTKDHLMAITKKIHELGYGQKMPLYISGTKNLTISPEARAYSVTEASGLYTLANAILIDSSLKKVTFNFYLKISKPAIPTKGFVNKESAMEWLLSLVNQ